MLLTAVASASAAPPNQPQLDNASVQENQPAGTVVGTLSTTDPDPGETFTYKLVAGTGDSGNGSFKIAGDQLTTRRVLDFEAQSTYSVRVRVEDSHGERNRSVFAIQVTNDPADDPSHRPSNIKLSNHQIDENMPAETVVGTLKAIDEDPGDTFTYELVKGPGALDNTKFHIVGDQLKTLQPLDYEAKRNLLIRVQATDSKGNQFAKVFSLTVTNFQEIPFVSDRDGNNEVYVMNADGTGQTRLTNDPAIDAEPAFSPDGTKIAFTSSRDGNAEVYVMNADGTGQTDLPTTPSDDASRRSRPTAPRSPSQHRDGTRDLCHERRRHRPDQPHHQHVLDAHAVVLARRHQDRLHSFRDGNNEIYVMNADGTGPTASPQRRQRLRVRLLPRRHQDRLHHPPRRQRRGLRHERGRHRPDQPHQLPRQRFRVGVLPRRHQDRLHTRLLRGVCHERRRHRADEPHQQRHMRVPARLGAMRRLPYLMCTPEIARAITRRWISEVPSKIV